MTLAPKISKVEWNRFMRLRERVFDHITERFKTDRQLKSYEGRFLIGYELADFVGLGMVVRPWWTIHLDCYLVGPRRHYDWTGSTFRKALTAAERDINRWMKQEE